MKIRAHASYHPQAGFLPWWGWVVDEATGQTVGDGDGATAEQAMRDALRDACEELGLELVPEEREATR